MATETYSSAKKGAIVKKVVGWKKPTVFVCTILAQVSMFIGALENINHALRTPFLGALGSLVFGGIALYLTDRWIPGDHIPTATVPEVLGRK